MKQIIIEIRSDYCLVPLQRRWQPDTTMPIHTLSHEAKYNNYQILISMKNDYLFKDLLRLDL